MMDNRTSVAMNALLASLRTTVTAHDAVRQGIATHAERHRAAMHAEREKMAREAKINEGIVRANTQLFGTC
jgi:hypothetical protein